MEKENVTVARAFNNEGTFVRPGEKIKVDQGRAIELEGNRLVLRSGAKVAPTPLNKQAPDPQNKVGGQGGRRTNRATPQGV